MPAPSPVPQGARGHLACSVPAQPVPAGTGVLLPWLLPGAYESSWLPGHNAAAPQHGGRVPGARCQVPARVASGGKLSRVAVGHVLAASSGDKHHPSLPPCKGCALVTQRAPEAPLQTPPPWDAGLRHTHVRAARPRHSAAAALPRARGLSRPPEATLRSTRQGTLCVFMQLAICWV